MVSPSPDDASDLGLLGRHVRDQFMGLQSAAGTLASARLSFGLDGFDLRSQSFGDLTL